MTYKDAKYGLTLERVKELLDYDPETGIFTSRVYLGRFSTGRQVGYNTTKGYLHCNIDGQAYRLHRLAWLYVHGEWPQNHVDHKNGIKHDNRIENLRIASPEQNSSNSRISKRNSSGFKGVCFDKAYGKWASMIMVDGKLINIGRYTDPQQAAHEYNKAAIKHFGDFACLNPVGFGRDTAAPVDSVEAKS